MVALGYNEYGTSLSYYSRRGACTDTLLPVTQGGDWGGLVSRRLPLKCTVVNAHDEDYTKDC